MAEEIRIPFQAIPHTTSNPRVVWDLLTELPNSLFVPFGWRFRDGEVGELLLCVPELPPLNATPNAKARIRWVTSSASGNAWKLFLGLSDVVPDTDSINPTAFDLDTNATDTSGTAGRLNQFDITITGLTLQAGRAVIGRAKRDAGDAADLLAADVLITDILFIADA